MPFRPPPLARLRDEWTDGYHEANPPVEPERGTPGRGWARWVLIVAAALVVIWLLVPLFHGFHVGYNAATDNACMSHLIQWCGHTTPATVNSP